MVVESGRSRYSVIYVSSRVRVALALDRARGTDGIHSGSGDSKWPAPAGLTAGMALHVVVPECARECGEDFGFDVFGD